MTEGEEGLESRIDYRNTIPKEALHALYALEQSIRKSGLETSLLELVRMRASQITDVPFASTCTAKTRGRKARPSNGYMA